MRGAGSPGAHLDTAPKSSAGFPSLLHRRHSCRPGSLAEIASKFRAPRNIEPEQVTDLRYSRLGSLRYATGQCRGPLGPPLRLAKLLASTFDEGIIRPRWFFRPVPGAGRGKGFDRR